MTVGYFFPVSVLYLRYYKNAFLGFIFIEILPYVACAIISTGNVLQTLAGIIALYSFYEIGYLWNDKISIKNESNPRVRLEFDKYILSRFVTIRAFITAILVYFLCVAGGVDPVAQATLVVMILIVFYLHNSIINVQYRLSTFIILNFLKIVFVFWLGSIETALMVGFLPFLLIKIINYSRVKNILQMSEAQEEAVYLPIFIAAFTVVPFVYPAAIPVVAVFAAIFNRKFIKQAAGILCKKIIEIK